MPLTRHPPHTTRRCKERWGGSHSGNQQLFAGRPGLQRVAKTPLREFDCLVLRYALFKHKEHCPKPVDTTIVRLAVMFDGRIVHGLLKEVLELNGSPGNARM